MGIVQRTQSLRPQNIELTCHFAAGEDSSESAEGCTAGPTSAQGCIAGPKSAEGCIAGSLV